MKENKVDSYNSVCIPTEDINGYNCRYYRDANRYLKLSPIAWIVFNYLLGEQDYANQPNKELNEGIRGTREQPNEFIISFRDLATAVGLSKNSGKTIQRAVDELEKKELIITYGKERQTLGYTINFPVWNKAIIKGADKKLEEKDGKRKRKGS